MYDTIKKLIDDNQVMAYKALVSQSTTADLKQALAQQDSRGNTLLHIAVQAGNYKFVKLLMAQGVDPAILDTAGDSAVHQAVRLGYINIVEELLGISATAEFRAQKTAWKDKDRHSKHQILQAAEAQALQVLTQENHQHKTPLQLAAELELDGIYERLLEVTDIGYSQQQLDSTLASRQQKLSSNRKNLLFAALIETFCPSASIAELSESFAYTGLTAGASAAVLFGVNVIFGIFALLSLGVLTYSNYKKLQAEQLQFADLESSKLEKFMLLNMPKRLAMLSEKPQLTAQEIQELQHYAAILREPIIKPMAIKGTEKNAADYVTPKERKIATLSSAAGFLCSYSGSLGVIGVGVGLVSQMLAGGAAAALATGPIGVGLAVGVGLLLAVGLGAYHYKQRRQAFATFGERHKILAEQDRSIYQLKQGLQAENTLELVDSSVASHQSRLSQTAHMLQQLDLQSATEVTTNVISMSPKAESQTSVNAQVIEPTDTQLRML